MLLFVDYIAAKQIIAPALNTLVGGPSKVYEASHTQITGAIHALVGRAIKSGDIRRGLDPFDLLRGPDRRRQCGVRPGLATKRQETRGYPDRRFAPDQHRLTQELIEREGEFGSPG